jgi:hypothetical protein
LSVFCPCSQSRAFWIGDLVRSVGRVETYASVFVIAARRSSSETMFVAVEDGPGRLPPPGPHDLGFRAARGRGVRNGPSLRGAPTREVSGGQAGTRATVSGFVNDSGRSDQGPSGGLSVSSKSANYDLNDNRA